MDGNTRYYMRSLPYLFWDGGKEPCEEDAIEGRAHAEDGERNVHPGARQVGWDRWPRRVAHTEGSPGSIFLKLARFCDNMCEISIQ